jgi:hypothetical protein
VVLKRLRGEPVVGEQLRLRLTQRVEQVDGVIALAELVALNAERHHDAEEHGERDAQRIEARARS